MFGSLGVPELLFIFGLALLVFGPRKLPEVGRALGRGMAELRKASNEIRRTINTELIDEEIRQANPSRLVRDSLRDVKDGLDRAVRGDDEPSSKAKPAHETALRDAGAVGIETATAPATVGAPRANPALGDAVAPPAAAVEDDPLDDAEADQSAVEGTVSRARPRPKPARLPEEPARDEPTRDESTVDDPARDDP